MAEAYGNPEQSGGIPIQRTQVPKEERTNVEVVSGGSIAEGFGGLAVVALAIIGLAGILPGLLAAIATIVAGVALLAEGGAIAARYKALMDEIDGGTATSAELGGGMSVEILGGLAGIALGILALVGLVPVVLMAVAVIVFGAALLFGSGSASRLDVVAARMRGHDERVNKAARDTVLGAAATQALVGIAAVVLGILALIGMAPALLVLVGLLCVGAALLFTGSALSYRLLSMLGH